MLGKSKTCHDKVRLEPLDSVIKRHLYVVGFLFGFRGVEIAKFDSCPRQVKDRNAHVQRMFSMMLMVECCTRLFCFNQTSYCVGIVSMMLLTCVQSTLTQNENLTLYFFE